MNEFKPPLQSNWVTSTQAEHSARFFDFLHKKRNPQSRASAASAMIPEKGGFEAFLSAKDLINRVNNQLARERDAP